MQSVCYSPARQRVPCESPDPNSVLERELKQWTDSLRVKVAGKGMRQARPSSLDLRRLAYQDQRG